MPSSDDDVKFDPLTVFFFCASIAGLVWGVAGQVNRVLPNSSLWLQYGIGMAVALFAAGITSLIIYLRARKWRFHFVQEDRGGDKLIEHVKSAKQTILATHFTSEPPSEGYIGLLLDKLGERVRLRRAVYFHQTADDPSYVWLRRFAEFPQFYQQTHVECPLPFNFVVIDSRYVWIFLPSDSDDYFREAVWLENEKVAQRFTVIFDKIVNGRARRAAPLQPVPA